MQTYTEAEIQERLTAYPRWSLNAAGQLEGEYTFKNFSRAMLFANAVGYLAENADHHPDLLIHDYKYVRISLMTHSAGGITDNDFNLLAQIEAIAGGIQ
mgnify:CR=1 FL=1